MVCEQLPNHGGRKAERESRSIGDDDVPVGFGNRFCADGEHLAASCANLCHARLVLREERIVWEQYYGWAVLVDERQRAVLEFAKGHGVGVEVGDLFELERRLRRDGEHVPASEKKEVLVFGEFSCRALDSHGVREHFLHDFGKFRELFERAAVFSEILSTLDGVKQGQKLHGGELGSKGFGGCHAHFGSGAGEEPEIRKAGNRRSHHVDDAEGFSALGLYEFQGFDGVCRFARLRDENVERLGVDLHWRVQKLARDFGRGAHSGEFPKRVASRPSRVERRSAGDEFDPFDIHVPKVLERRGVEHEVFEIGAALEYRLHDFGLFEDFFEHEVGELALVGFEAFGFYAFERARNERSFGFDFVTAVRLYAYEVAVVEKRHLVGISRKGLHV